MGFGYSLLLVLMGCFSTWSPLRLCCSLNPGLTWDPRSSVLVKARSILPVLLIGLAHKLDCCAGEMSPCCQVQILRWRKHRRKENSAVICCSVLQKRPIQVPSGSAQTVRWDLLLLRCREVPVTELRVIARATLLRNGADDQRVEMGFCNTFLMNWQTRAKF